MKISISRLLSLTVLLCFLAIPLLTTGTYHKFLLIIVFIYAIAAIGLNILAGYAGQFSLGHAALMAVGAYGSTLVSLRLASVPWLAATGLHVWIGLLTGIVAGGLAGAVLAYPALRVRGPYLAMVTVAFGWVVWKILQEWVPVTGGDLGIASIPKPQLGAWILDTNAFYYVVFAGLLIALLIQHLLLRAPIGLRIRALKYSEIGLASLGVSVHRLKIMVFIISAAFAGCAGSLFAIQQSYISPDNFQFFSSVFLLLAVLFGGAGTALGPILGAAVLTLLPEFLQGFDHYRLIIYGSFILLTLYFLPEGVMGPVERLFSTTQPLGSMHGAPSSISREVDGASVELKGVSLSFGGIKALQDIDIAIAAGEIHAIIGPNGAGKTTLINVLTGFYKPDSGSFQLDKIVTAIGSLDAAARHGVVRTFQTIKLFGPMTVLEHVLTGLPRDSTNRTGEAESILNFVGISALRNHPANALAYGHRRLLEIARALATRPRFLLLDEPAAGLVHEEIELLALLIQKLRETGMTVLIVEHHMDLVMAVSDQITVLNYGRVIARGTPAEIQRHDDVIEAYLGKSHAAA